MLKPVLGEPHARFVDVRLRTDPLDHASQLEGHGRRVPLGSAAVLRIASATLVDHRTVQREASASVRQTLHASAQVAGSPGSEACGTPSLSLGTREALPYFQRFTSSS